MQSAVGEVGRVEVIDPVTGERELVWADDLCGGEAPWDGRIPEAWATDEVEGGPGHGRRVDPIGAAVAALRDVDRSMAVVLRAVAEAGPADGLPARRLVALQAQATGVDVRFLERAVQVLAAMPRSWAAFDDGGLSWSQLRGVVIAARRLPAAQRQVLDDALTGEIARGRVAGEPDRVVEVAGDLIARLDPAGQEAIEAATEREQRLVLQPDFDGGGEVHGYLGTELFPLAASALDAAADAPVAADAPPVTDDDGQPVPTAAQPIRSRAGQWAEALGRICTAFLVGETTTLRCTCGACDPTDADGGAHPRRHDGSAPSDGSDDRADTDAPASDDGDVEMPGDAHAADGETGQPAGGHRPGCAAGMRRRARPTMFVVTSLAELLDHDLGVGSVVSRLLLRRGSGRRRISRALTRHLAEDADLVPIFTDDDHLPVAIGDSCAPISPALRRAVMARDQGCRMPGCDVPAEWCDVNHAIPRHEGGATEMANLHLACRPDHVKLTRHGWKLRLDPDGTLHVTIGRRTYVTRPRLSPPTQHRRPR